MFGPLEVEIPNGKLRAEQSKLECALQLLKGSILRGTNSITNFLKKSSFTFSPVGGGVLLNVDNLRSPIRLPECSNAATATAEWNSVPEVLENSRKQKLEAKVLPLKRSKIDSADENVIRQFLENQHDASAHDLTSAKRVKHCSSSIIESKTDNEPYKTKPLKNSCRKLYAAWIADYGSEKNKLETYQEGFVAEDGSLDSVAPVRCYKISEKITNRLLLPSKTTVILGLTSGNEAKEKYEDWVRLNGTRTLPLDKPQINLLFDNWQYDVQPKAASSVDIEQKNFRDKAECDVLNCCEDGGSSDSDGFNDEENYIATKKAEFLRSQCTSGHDLSTNSGCSEQNLCMKCNKGGKLLHCATSTCPLAVHENCLGKSAKSHVNGSLYCPFCVYSLSISECLVAKKKALSARNDLASFLHKNMWHLGKEVDLSNRKAHNSPRGIQHVSGDGESNETPHLPPKRGGPEDHIGSHLHVEEETGVYRKVNVSSGKRFGGEWVNKENLSARQLERNQLPVAYEDAPDKHFPEGAIVVSPYRARVGEKIQQEWSKTQTINQLKESACVHDVESEENSEDEMSISTSCSAMCEQNDMHYQYPPISGSRRRKKLPWTAEEEEILKVGFQKFAGDHKRGVPWKKIFEFGGNRFCGGRTPTDLKDKWRNMCKSGSKWK